MNKVTIQIFFVCTSKVPSPVISLYSLSGLFCVVNLHVCEV